MGLIVGWPANYCLGGNMFKKCSVDFYWMDVNVSSCTHFFITYISINRFTSSA